MTVSTESKAGELFRQHRELLGLTQTELGRQLDVHYTTVQNWETGRIELPRTAALAMCWLLHTAPELKPSVARRYAKQAL